MDNHKVNQEGNVVIGNQAGRDININNATRKPTCMSNLVEKLKEEMEGNQTFHEIIEELQRYRTAVPDEKIQGLETKLEAGGRRDFLDFALLMKERFAKKLAKFEVYQSAQEIFVLLLAQIYTRFTNHVYPKILEHSDITVVNDLIQTKVVDPVEDMLEENELLIYADEINGMIYFLTGNCYIKWV
jgi:2-oxoglutarate dehydrogenase complex dehydrogenase (E1) component-like enzyme